MLLDDDGDDQWLLGAAETEGEGEQGDEQDKGELATSASASGPGVSAGSSSDEEGHFLDLGVDTDPLAHAVVEDGDTTGHSSQEEGEDETPSAHRCGCRRDCLKLFPAEAVEANRFMVLEFEKPKKKCLSWAYWRA